jgi:hypothetical protein
VWDGKDATSGTFRPAKEFARPAAFLPGPAAAICCAIAGLVCGPYWYLYYTNPKTGKYTSRYIGKNLTPELAEEFGDPPAV